jgi:hypothetical protein
MEQRIKTTFIKCNHCGYRATSPTQYYDVAGFKNALSSGNTNKCRSCGKVVNCNSSTMSYVLE